MFDVSVRVACCCCCCCCCCCRRFAFGSYTLSVMLAFRLLRLSCCFSWGRFVRTRTDHVAQISGMIRTPAAHIGSCVPFGVVACVCLCSARCPCGHTSLVRGRYRIRRCAFCWFFYCLFGLAGPGRASVSFRLFARAWGYVSYVCARASCFIVFPFRVVSP